MLLKVSSIGRQTLDCQVQVWEKPLRAGTKQKRLSGGKVSSYQQYHKKTWPDFQHLRQGLRVFQVNTLMPEFPVRVE